MKERPGPGDDDGRGKARLQLKKDQICFELSWRNIDAPTAAHVHRAPREEAGPVVVELLSVPAPGLGGAGRQRRRMRSGRSGLDR